MDNNKLENNELIENVSNIKIEKMRYQNNSSSYMLGFSAIGFFILAVFICLNSTQPVVMTALYILIAIFVLLFGFLATEKVKSYNKQFSFVMIGLGVASLLQIFWIPLQLIMYYPKWHSAYYQLLEETDDAKIKELSATIADCLKYLGNIVVESEKGYLPSSGVFRGILAIILFIGSAACFIYSGIICYKKNKLLTQYLESIKISE